MHGTFIVSKVEQGIGVSPVPGPSPAPVFDCLQYAKTFSHTASDQKLEPGKAWEQGYIGARCTNPAKHSRCM